MSKRMTAAQLWRAARAARLLRVARTSEPVRHEERCHASERKQAAPQAIQELGDLIEATELLRDTVHAGEKEEGARAMATLLLKFMATFGHDDDFTRKALPSLGRLTELVLAGEFDQAKAHIVVWLVRLRLISAALANAIQK